MHPQEQRENNVGLAYALNFSVDAKPCQEGIFLAYPEPPPEDFGTRLKRLAGAKGYTNRALAKLTGAHEVTVSRWMAGVVPETRTLLVLAEALEVPPSYLLPKRAKKRKRITRRGGEERGGQG